MARPLLFFLHGLACGAEDWTEVERCCAAWAESVAIDLPGHGGKPARDTISIAGLAEAANDARSAWAGRRQILVGHSMGCRVALEMARRWPADLAGLVLIDSSLQGNGAPDEAVRARRALPATERQARMRKLFAGFFSAATPRAFAASAMERLESFDPALLASFEDAIVRWDAGEAEQAVASSVVPLLAIQSTVADEQLNRRPIGASEDTPWTALVRHVATENAEVANLEGLGHFPQVDDPIGLSARLRAFAARLGLLDDGVADRQCVSNAS